MKDWNYFYFLGTDDTTQHRQNVPHNIYEKTPHAIVYKLDKTKH